MRRRSRPRTCVTGGERARRALLLATASILVLATYARSACNIIPSASTTLRSSLGAVNRPFAAPGDFVEVSVDPVNCDPASPGLTVDPLQQLVTIVYAPPASTRSMVVLAADCTSSVVASKIKACQKVPGFTAPITCISQPDAGIAARVDANGMRRLSFRFPNTDAAFAPAGDQNTLAGPAAIAVTSTSVQIGAPTSQCYGHPVTKKVD